MHTKQVTVLVRQGLHIGLQVLQTSKVVLMKQLLELIAIARGSTSSLCLT